MTANRQNSRSKDTFVERRSRGRRWLLPAILVIIALFVFLLPTIVIHSPLKSMAIDFATKGVDGDVEIGKISAGWFSPIELQDVRLVTGENHEIINVASVRTSLSLLSLLTTGRYGTIQIVEPTIDVMLTPDSSNIEDAFSSWLTADSPDSESAIPELQLRIVDGTARVRSNTLAKSGLYQSINAIVDLSAGDSPLKGEVQFQCSTEQSNTGRVALQFWMDKGQQQIKGEDIQLDLQTDQLPLDALATALTRIVGPLDCTGIVNSEVQFSLRPADGFLSAKFETFNGRQLAWVAPKYIGQDQFVARSLDGSGSVELTTSSATAHQFKVETEFASINADGHFDFGQLARLGTDATIPASQFRLDGQVDLAQVASMLPETTHLRQDVAMKSGLLKMTAGTRNENGSPRLVINAEATNINFMLDNENVVWHHPLRAVAVAGSQNGGLKLHDVQLKSDFLNLSGHAAMDQGKLHVSGDLRKLSNQIGQVVDLSGMQLAGLADGEFEWKKPLNDQDFDSELPLEVSGSFVVANPIVQVAGNKPWSESRIDVSLKSSCLANRSTGVIGVNQGQLDFQVGTEKLVASLALPIADISSDWKYQFNCQADGSIARWLQQLGNFTELPEFICDGQLKSQFLLTMNSQTLRLNQVQFQASDFVFDGFALSIREPKVSGRVNLKYEYSDGNLLLTKSKVTSPSLAFSTDHLSIATNRKLLADGALVFRGNANRASQWIGLSMPGDTVRWDGIANGTMTFGSESGMLGGNLSAKVKDLVLVQPVAVAASPVGAQTVSHQQKFEAFWNEPDARLTAKVQIADDFNGLELKNAQLISKAADVQVNGTIKQLATNMNADLRGRWNIKWDSVNQTIREMAGESIEFSGTGWQPLKIVGPLYLGNQKYDWIPNQLTAHAGVQWEQAKFMGVPLGQSKVNLRLQQSMVRLSAKNQTTLLDQALQLQPILDLRQAEPVVYLKQGKLLDQWNISVEDSRTWLKFAAPLIADATATQGQLSATLNGASIPLFNPLQASARGELEIENVRVGPGPLAMQLIPVIDQIKSILKPQGSSLSQQATWIELKPQRLPFVIQNGRVFHDGFEMSHREFIIRTTGSVGFDQSLNLVVEIPILEKWVEGDKVLTKLVGQSISIPVSGTLSKPRLDRKAITQSARQMLRDSTLGVVKEKVNSEVNELQQKFNNKVLNEVNQFQNQLNDKIKNDFEDKVQNELRNGLDKLFGRDKQ